jgi:hypothetical protein
LQLTLYKSEYPRRRLEKNKTITSYYYSDLSTSVIPIDANEKPWWEDPAYK